MGFFSLGKTFIGMVFLQQKRKDTAIVVAKVRQKRIDSETEEVMTVSQPWYPSSAQAEDTYNRKWKSTAGKKVNSTLKTDYINDQSC